MAGDAHIDDRSVEQERADHLREIADVTEETTMFERGDEGMFFAERLSKGGMVSIEPYQYAIGTMGVYFSISAPGHIPQLLLLSAEDVRTLARGFAEAASVVA